MDWIYVAQDGDQWRGSCERANKPSGSVTCWEFLETMSNCRLLDEHIGVLVPCDYTGGCWGRGGWSSAAEEWPRNSIIRYKMA